MAITYDAPSDTITITGYTEENPCTFTDIYDADQAGGWGRVSKQGTYQFQVDCKLQIGSGGIDTWFKTENEQVVFTKGVTNTLYLFGWYYSEKCHFRMGRLDGNNEAYNGSVLVFQVNKWDNIFYAYNADIQFYDSTIVFTGTGICKWVKGAYENGAIDIKRSRVELAAYNYFELKVANCQIDGLEVSRGQFLPEETPNYTWNDIHLLGDYNVVLHPQFGQPMTIQNLKVSNAINHQFNIYGNAQVEVINVDMDWSKITFEAPQNQEWWKFFNSFDLTVEDKDGNPISGATVTLWNKDEAQVFQTTTDVNGKITTQNVLYAYLDASTGSTPTFYSPYRLKIEKAGYQTYDHDGIALDEKTKLEIKLSKAVGVFLDFGRPVINLKKSDPENKNVMVC